MVERKYAPKDSPVIVRDGSGRVLNPPEKRQESVEGRAARKTTAGLHKLSEPTPELLVKSIAELNTMSDDLDRQRAAIMEKKRLVHSARLLVLSTEDAAAHGLTAEQYAKIKSEAKAAGVPLRKALSLARKANALALQVAQANAVAAQIQAVK